MLSCEARMKNLLVLCVTLVLGYFAYDALQPAPPPPPPPPPTPAPVAVAKPVPPPKLYFHSALDAPPMAANMTSGTSYFSTDPNSHFSPSSSGYGTNEVHLDGRSTYIVGPGGTQVSIFASPGGLANAANRARQVQSVPVLRNNNGDNATPNPLGSAR